MAAKSQHKAEVVMQPKDILQLWQRVGEQQPVYDSAILAALVIESFDEAKKELVMSIKVDQSLINQGKFMHGGAYATIADMTTSVLTAIFDVRYTVSVELATSYLRSAPLGTKVLIHNKLNKTGGMLAFSEATFLTEKGDVLATTRHIKAFISGPKL